MRNPYDRTEAFITDKFSRRLSNKYAIALSQKLHIGHIKKTIHPSLLHMSAQWYIDVFNNLYENNELDFISQQNYGKENNKNERIKHNSESRKIK